MTAQLQAARRHRALSGIIRLDRQSIEKDARILKFNATSDDPLLGSFKIHIIIAGVVRQRTLGSGWVWVPSESTFYQTT